MTDDLRQAIAEYVNAGRRDAFEFSALVYPEFKDVPGKEIQRMIDEEYSKKGMRSMKIFVWEWVGQVSDNYHCDGGLLVVAKDEGRAKELIEQEPHVVVTDAEWRGVRIFETSADEQERVITFPDAGCC